MKAIIMAGGEGSRLRPMTCDCPKPMLPLLGRPVMAYALDLLRRHGVQEAGVTLMYLPRRVSDCFGDGTQAGMHLRYFVEDKPLGTAGSVALAREFLDETFFVLSGDGVTDCDLSAALRFHREKGALATMVLRHVENPLEYGVVSADHEGRVIRFVEKPGWSEVSADTVNTGIYILEPRALSYIPPDQSFDFGKDLFPLLLEKGEPLYAFIMDGYWCDIGDAQSFLRAHADALDGRIRLPMPARPGAVNRMPGARIDRSAVLEGPCYIGRDVQIGPGARIGAYTVLGDGCRVGAYASIKRSVLLSGVDVQEHAQVRGAVVMEQAVLGPGSSLFEECVLGSRTQLGAGASAVSGVRIWPDKRIPEDVHVEKNVVWGDVHREEFRGDCLPLSRLEDCIRAVWAYVSVTRVRSALLCGEGSTVAEAWIQAVRSALMSCGVQVVLGGGGQLPQARYQLRSIAADGGCYVCPGCLRFLDEAGIELPGAVQRQIQQRMIREEGAQPLRRVYRRPAVMRGGNLYYLGYLRMLGTLPEKQVAVCTQEEGLLELAEAAFRQAGCLVRAEWEEELMELGPFETGIWLNEDGGSFLIADDEGVLAESEEELLRAWVLLQAGERQLILPARATHSVDLLAEREGAQVRRVRSESAELLHAMLEESPVQFMMRTDGIYAALCTLRALKDTGLTLKQWKKDMPILKRSVRTVPMEYAARGRALARLGEGESRADLTEGMRVEDEQGWAFVSPGTDRQECTVVGEAYDMEAASELCDRYVEKLLKALSE